MMEGEYLLSIEGKAGTDLDATNSGTAFWTLVIVTVPLALIAIGLITLSIMRYVQKPEKVIKKFEWLRTFYVWLGALAILGGTWAFFLPIALNSGFNKDDDGPVLRQLLIYTVGGLLGVITLGETHRKNTLEKTKNEQDHIRQVHAEIRQVHAERRSRYTTAIEQLSSDKASIRLGGIYSLVGLVDEWLADEKTIPNIKERRQKGQVIINNLCAYIRSPFPLAEQAEQLDGPYAKDLQKDFKGDKEKFDTDKQTFKQNKANLEEERQIRKSIMQEMHERLHKNNESVSWSDFDYDFSNTHFFYFTDFMNSHFKTLPTFFGATFNMDANFIGATFKEGADFTLVTFNKAVNKESANFMNATFMKKAHFLWATFTGYANFTKATFKEDSNYTGAKDDRFHWTTDANFIGATFKEGANFSQTTFQTKPIFESTLDKPYRAWFSNKAKLESYNFQVSNSSPYKIEIEKHRNPDGTITTVPKGCGVFNPSLTKISTSNGSIIGISVKGVSANGVPQI